jgi:hypothetical protein
MTETPVKTIELGPHENWIKDLGMFKCYLTADATPEFRVRGVVLAPPGSTPDRKPARPATTLVLPMSLETGVQLALAISKAATEAGIPLPKGVLVQGE